MTDVREALIVAAAVGGYFALELDDAGRWPTLSELVEDEPLLQQQVQGVRQGLAAARGLATDAIDLRPAASVWMLGTVSRLLSPLFGATVLADVLPRCTLSSVRWRATDQATGGSGNRLQLSIEDIGGLAGPPAALARAMHPEVLDTVVAPLVSVCATVFRVSEKVLWGNVSSALSGANTVLADAQPANRQKAHDMLRDVIDHGVLADTGRFTRNGFARNSCCLIYRVPQCSYCGDCVLLDRPN